MLQGVGMKVGAIAYRKTSKGVEICLVSSRRHRGKLTFPKGASKTGEKPVAAAKRELFEEAGLRGKIKQKSRPIYYQPPTSGQEPILYFLVKVTEIADKWPESKVRKRVFSSLRDMRRLPLGEAPRQLLQKLRRVPRLAKTRRDYISDVTVKTRAA